MNKPFGVAIIMALALAGCQTTNPAARVANNKISCAEYGFKPGTEGYANCMMSMDIAAQNADQARRDRLSRGLRVMGAVMAAPQPSPMVTCTSNRFGNTSTTTCM